MNNYLLSGVPKEERAELESFIRNSKKLLDIQVKLLYNMYRDAENVSTTDYDNSSWAFKQAHLNGKKEVIRNLIKHYSLDNEEFDLTKVEKDH